MTKPTPEIDPRAPEYIEFSERLTRRIELFHGRNLYDIDVVKEIDDAVATLQRNTKLTMPKLTALILRKLGIIEIIRADLEPKAVRETMVYLIRKYGVSTEDMLWAMARSFPSHDIHKEGHPLNPENGS